MGIRTRTAVGLATALMGLTLLVAPAGSASAYAFPSTNDANRTAGLPHVDQVSMGPGTVTLEFINATNSLAFFEYRIDGVPVGSTAHPVVAGDVIYPGVCVDGRAASICSAGPVVRTFTATATVEVRLALGGERDWDFDWTEFTVGQPPTEPTTPDDCKKGGWKAFGFRNQGQCIRFVKTGKPQAAPSRGENRGTEKDLSSDHADQHATEHRPSSAPKPTVIGPKPDGIVPEQTHIPEQAHTPEQAGMPEHANASADANHGQERAAERHLDAEERRGGEVPGSQGRKNADS